MDQFQNEKFCDLEVWLAYYTADRNIFCIYKGNQSTSHKKYINTIKLRFQAHLVGKAYTSSQSLQGSVTLRTRIVPFCLLISSFSFRFEQSKRFSKLSNISLGVIVLQTRSFSHITKFGQGTQVTYVSILLLLFDNFWILPTKLLDQIFETKFDGNKHPSGQNDQLFLHSTIRLGAPPTTVQKFLSESST